MITTLLVWIAVSLLYDHMIQYEKAQTIKRAEIQKSIDIAFEEFVRTGRMS